MTREELDTMWQKALIATVRDGELYTRYRFAELVAAAEREACAKVCDPKTLHSRRYIFDWNNDVERCAAAIRARGEA